MKLIATDVDGVLTDGCVILDSMGNESKRVCYRDLDAIGIGRRAGYEFAFLTGEDTEMARFLARRFKVELAYFGAKDKVAALKKLSHDSGLALASLIYVGDSNPDAPALRLAGLGVAPADATPAALAAADRITLCGGGQGVLLELVNRLVAGEWAFPREKGIS